MFNETYESQIPAVATTAWFTPLLTAAVTIILLLLHLMPRRGRNFPPGPWRLPFIGNFHQLGPRPYVKFMEMRKQYGDIIGVDFASFRGVVLNEAKLIREALSMPEFSGRPKLRPFLERFGDGTFRGIISNEGEGQLQHRRFAFRNLRDFGMGRTSMESLILDEINELMNTLSKFGGAPFKTENIFNLTAVNGLWWILVGERFEHNDQKLREYVKVLTDAMVETPTAGAFWFFPWLSMLAPKLTGYDSFMAFQSGALQLMRTKYDEQKASFTSGHHRHFLDVFIQEVIDCKDPDSAFFGVEGERNLIASVVDLFIAGIETTSTTMSWIVMLLALRPEIQDQIAEEVLDIIGPDHGQPSLDDQHRMPYVQAFLTEVLRYSSIVPLSVFHSTVEDVVFHGFTIPKDTLIMPNQYGVHHDPEVWGDPEVFRPERFITTSGSFVKPGPAFMPFSMGKRSCIGEALARNTLFLFLVTLTQRFKIGPNPAIPMPVIDYSPGLVLHPKPYEYVLEPRRQAQVQTEMVIDKQDDLNCPFRSRHSCIRTV